MNGTRLTKEQIERLQYNDNYAIGIDGRIVRLDPELNDEFWTAFDAAHNDDNKSGEDNE